MTSFYDGQITDILPENFSQEPEVQALSYALREGTRMLSRYAQRMYIYTDIDHQPDEVLDLLAAELRTQYYSSTLDIDTKRRLVKNTLIWYMTAGTPQAVEELVGAVFGEGRVEEWFEYGDDPYCFKITTDALLTPETSSFFSMMIRRVKNTRSHLRAIEIHRTVDQEIFSGAGQMPIYHPPVVGDGYRTVGEARQMVYMGALILQSSRPAAITDGFREKGGQVTTEMITGVFGADMAHPAAIIDGYRSKDQAGGTVYVGTAWSASSKQAAVRECLKGYAATVHLKTYTGAAGTTQQKPGAVQEGLAFDGKDVETTIQGGTALGNRYKSTVTEKEAGDGR